MALRKKCFIDASAGENKNGYYVQWVPIIVI